MHNSAPITFDNSYARLPGDFYRRLPPTPVAQPESIAVNRELAAALAIDPDWLASPEGVQVVAGNRVPEGAEPLAAAYAGHQFGSFNPQLGDGRALLLGEVIAVDGRRYDLQLKGAGATPYSRGGDGRSPLGPVLREYLLSEAMHRLGVPTTRALAAVTTGEKVRREQFLPGAVLARVASSHVRIGSFQFFAARGDREALQRLLDYVIQRHYPELSDSPNPALALLKTVMERQAQLLARWQCLGFIHGVMNTDNMLLCGETVDYGPCAFMDAFDPDQVFSSIDHGGRYRYSNQPAIAHWNLACLAEALLPLLHKEPQRAVPLAQAQVDEFAPMFGRAYRAQLRHKLGLSENTALDDALVSDLFTALAGADFTLSFRYLCAAAAPEKAEATLPPGLYTPPEALRQWLPRWREVLAQDVMPEAQRWRQMCEANPLFIPRNHRVEEAIAAATAGDLGPFHRLRDCLDKPFRLREKYASLAAPPRPEEIVQQTFCGT